MGSALADLRRLVPASARIAIVGVGNELNGDDAAGVLVLRRLQAAGVQREDLLLVEGGPAPENFTAVLRRFHPALVLIIDAAHLDSPPGTLACIDASNTDGLEASTHTLPPSVLASFLAHEFGCRVLILGIQPEQLEFDQPVSAPVARAVEALTADLSDWLRTRT